MPQSESHIYFPRPSVFVTSGIHQQLITLNGVIDSWANRLKSPIGRLETLHHSDWSKLEKALGSWINLCEEALVNITNIQTEDNHKPHTK